MKRFQRFSFVLVLGFLAAILTVLPGRAAGLIYLQFGPLQVSIPVQAVKTFAETGTSQPLNPLLNRLSPQLRSQLQNVVRSTFELRPEMVAQFTYTSSGERLLKEAGEILQTASGKNGFYSLRSAAIATSIDPEGFSLLNFLRHLPVDVKVDLRRAFALQRRISQLLRQTSEATEAIAQRSNETATSAFNFSQQDLRQAGSFSFTQQTRTFRDTQRDRTLVIDLFVPENNTPVPVVVVSNGLGAQRDRFNRLAQHLASYGFAVVLLDHPGSDRNRLLDFYKGLYRENFDTAEFSDRPLDITFLLNELEPINQSELQNALNLKQVGIFGYSFGGTTAFSLAGAEMEFSTLERACATETFILNISLLYQCQALTLQPPPSLQDERVKAVYVFVSFGRSLFGSGLSKISIPVLWEASNADFLTPLLIEQLPAYRYLTTPDRYFALTKGLPHAQINHEIMSRLTNIRSDWEELKAISERYHRALAIAFFKTHLAGDERYRPYLSAAYTKQISEPPYALSLVKEIPD